MIDNTRNITRTIYAGYLQTALFRQVPFVSVANTTLNEKFGIQQNQLLPANVYPTAKYFCIGNGGHKPVTGSDGRVIIQPNQHRATDASLFDHLPFVLRPINNDLTGSEIAKYGLRRLETHGGAQYVAYYLKRMDSVSSAIGLKYTTVTNGVESTTDFIPTAANLNPVPPVISNTGINPTSGDYVTSSVRDTIVLTNSDVTEITDACIIKYGSANNAIISEIGICSGYDKVISISSGSGTINFNEVIQTQIMAFVNTMYSLQYMSDGFTLNLDSGVNEALFNVG